jgi:hypothetical protein
MENQSTCSHFTIAICHHGSSSVVFVGPLKHSHYYMYFMSYAL